MIDIWMRKQVPTSTVLGLYAVLYGGATRRRGYLHGQSLTGNSCHIFVIVGSRCRGPMVTRSFAGLSVDTGSAHAIKGR